MDQPTVVSYMAFLTGGGPSLQVAFRTGFTVYNYIIIHDTLYSVTVTV